MPAPPGMSSVFGGFTAASWHSKDEYIGVDSVEDAFLFSLIRPPSSGAAGGKKGLLKFPIRDSKKHRAIYGHARHGPYFPGGSDIYLDSPFFTNKHTYANPGGNYDISSSLATPGSEERKAIFDGAYNFLCSEVEVFLVTKR